MSRVTPEEDRFKAWRRRLRAGWLRRAGNPEEATFWLVRSLPGMLPKDQVRLLYRTVAGESGPGDIAEVGSWMGKSTVTIARALVDRGLTDCRVYAIDPHIGSIEHGDIIRRAGFTLPHFKESVRLGSVEHLVEPMVMTSTLAAAELLERGVGLRLAFIDGAHDEQSVREDIRAFRPLMRPKGLMAFHDCDPAGGAFPGVWPAVDEELLRGAADVVDHAGVLWVLRLRE